MTFGELKSRTLARANDASTPEYYGSGQAGDAINEGQRLLVLLSLCLEDTATLALSANTTFYQMLDTWSDWIAPLRIRIQGGAKLSPGSLEDFEAMNEQWKAQRDDPARYAHLGFNLLAVYPCPSSTGTTLEVTRAKFPAAMTLDANTPEIPVAYHPALEDYGIWRLRCGDGGAELARANDNLARFLQAADKLNARSMARGRSLGYDTLAPELQFDALRRLLSRAA